MDSTPQEPKWSIKNLHYVIVLVTMYFLWGGFFPEPTFLNQLVFNFALFYPIGFMNGYFEDSRGILPVFQTAILFNVMTYILVFTAGQKVPLLIAGVDFVSMFLFITIGIRIGKRK